MRWYIAKCTKKSIPEIRRGSCWMCQFRSGCTHGPACQSSTATMATILAVDLFLFWSWWIFYVSGRGLYCSGSDTGLPWELRWDLSCLFILVQVFVNVPPVFCEAGFEIGNTGEKSCGVKQQMRVRLLQRDPCVAWTCFSSGLCVHPAALLPCCLTRLQFTRQNILH